MRRVVLLFIIIVILDIRLHGRELNSSTHVRLGIKFVMVLISFLFVLKWKIFLHSYLYMVAKGKSAATVFCEKYLSFIMEPLSDIRGPSWFYRAQFKKHGFNTISYLFH